MPPLLSRWPQRPTSPPVPSRASSLYPPRSINGYSYCNMPRPVFKQGTRVRWVLLSYGTEVDLHSPLFQNQALTVRGAVG